MFSLKSKFILAFGSLIVLLFAVVGIFFLDAKEQELLEDVFQSTENFTNFASPEIIRQFEQFPPEENAFVFERELQAILAQESNISALLIAQYSGEVLYDSKQELQNRSDLNLTLTKDNLERVQSVHPSILTDNGELYYLLEEDGTLHYTNFNEEKLEAPDPRSRILTWVTPYNAKYALWFELDYTQVQERLRESRNQILGAGAIAFLLTLLLSIMLSFNVTRPLAQLEEGARRLAEGKLNTRVHVNTKDELKVLADQFNHMASEIQHSLKDKVYRERVQKELELAADIQKRILPPENLALTNLDIAGGLIPASEIGGDSFDYISLGKGNYLTYIGDVTGHGVAAGIVASIANAVLYNLKGEASLKEIAIRLNEVIRAKTSERVFMTMVLTEWNEKKKELSYLNSGHPPLLHFQAKTKSIMHLKLGGIALGMQDKIDEMIREYKLPLESEDVVILYSDGIAETRNTKGEAYGLDRLKAVACDICQDLNTAEAIKNAILADVNEFRGKKQAEDDMTLVVLKRKKD